MVIAFPVAIVLWGLLIWIVVGDKGLPPWDYSIRPDVPGQSVYSTEGAKEFTGLGPVPPGKQPVVKQHIMRRGGESEQVPFKSGEIK